MRSSFSGLLILLYLVVQVQTLVKVTSASFLPRTINQTAIAQSQAGASTASTTSDLPTVQLGLKSGESCWTEWEKWSTTSENCKSTTYTLDNLSGETITTTVFETFKLCDGHPRARVTNGDRTSITTVRDFPIFTGKTFGTTTTVETIIVPPSGTPVTTITTIPTSNDPILASKCITVPPSPSCSVTNIGICSTLFSIWTSGNFTRMRPPCTATFASTTAQNCEGCIMFVPSIQLIYFPVSMTGNFCGDYSTVSQTTADTNKPATIETLGTTFTSGLAYLSYAGVTVNGCGPTKGPGILALPSSEVSSLRGLAPAQPIAGNVHWSFNFADLAPNPVPWDAWISQATCAGHESQPQCQTITQAAYRPGLVYPRQFFEMEPEWKSCTVGVFGIVDPPIELPIAHVAAGPTHGGTGPITSSPPVAQPSKSHEVPTATSVQVSLDPGHDGSSIASSETPVITIDPISASFLPDITTISNTNDISVVDPTSVPSGNKSVPSTGSSSMTTVPSCVYTTVLVLAVALLGLIRIWDT